MLWNSTHWDFFATLWDIFNECHFNRRKHLSTIILAQSEWKSCPSLNCAVSSFGLAVLNGVGLVVVDAVVVPDEDAVKGLRDGAARPELHPGHLLEAARV